MLFIIVEAGASTVWLGALFSVCYNVFANGLGEGRVLPAFILDKVGKLFRGRGTYIGLQQLVCISTLIFHLHLVTVHSYMIFVNVYVVNCRRQSVYLCAAFIIFAQFYIILDKLELT